MSNAVAALASSSATSPRTPKRPRSAVPTDQFDAFGELISSRLRSMDEGAATDLMGAI